MLFLKSIYLPVVEVKSVWQKFIKSVQHIKILCWSLSCSNYKTNKSFLCGADTQLLDLKVHITTAQGQSLVRKHTLQHTHSLPLLLADITNSLCCDWLVPTLVCARFDSSIGVDFRKTKGTRDVEKISTCCRGYCAVFCRVSPYLI